MTVVSGRFELLQDEQVEMGRLYSMLLIGSVVMGFVSLPLPLAHPLSPPLSLSPSSLFLLL